MLQSTKLVLFTVLFVVVGSNQLMAKLIGPPVSNGFTSSSTSTTTSKFKFVMQYIIYVYKYDLEFGENFVHTKKVTFFGSPENSVVKIVCSPHSKHD